MIENRVNKWETVHFGWNRTFLKNHRSSVCLFCLFTLSFLHIIHIPKSHHSASLNFRILILTQVFTLNSHLSHASYNFIAISFGKTFANDNIIWIIDKIYYGFWPALSIAMKKLETDQHLNEERECRKRVEPIFSRLIDINFEKELLITILMFLKSLCTRFSDSNISLRVFDQENRIR